MVRQIGLFCRLGFGSFHDLLLAVGTDPAMMIWLDAGRNIKSSSNENYSREVMELFTLGRGHYTETDAKEAARSLTGWVYEEATDQAVFRPERHDNTVKNMLCNHGNWDESDVTELLLKQQALYDFLASKLLQAFACVNPSPSWLARIAARLHQSLQIKDALYEIFIADEFYGEGCFRALVKTPMEYAAALARTLQIPLVARWWRLSRHGTGAVRPARCGRLARRDGSWHGCTGVCAGRRRERRAVRRIPQLVSARPWRSEI